jgi:hypothetical protein
MPYMINPAQRRQGAKQGGLSPQGIHRGDNSYCIGHAEAKEKSVAKHR